MAPTSALLQKYYVYDPGLNVGDELGRLRVLEDDKGKHVMAATLQMQYWIDQGMAGRLPVSELSDAGKVFLAQVTRGRSAEGAPQPGKLPKYDKRIQSGTPGDALRTPLSTKRRQEMLKSRKDSEKGNKKPAAKKPEAPKPAPTTPAPTHT